MPFRTSPKVTLGAHVAIGFAYLSLVHVEPTVSQVSTECTVEDESFVADGYCDELSENYNTDACAWDGGDCCETTVNAFVRV